MVLMVECVGCVCVLVWKIIFMYFDDDVDVFVFGCVVYGVLCCV